MRMSPFCRGGVAGVFLFVVAAGCDGSAARPRVQGKVTYHGAPVANRTLTLVFDAPAGESFSQMLPLADDGSFAGEVPRPGTYKVVIAESLAVLEGVTPPPAGGRIDVPPKYRQAATTDLDWAVERGTNTRDLDLKD